MSRALIIIDVQNFYFEGESQLEGSIEASLNIKKLLDYFRASQMPIFHVQHAKESLGELGHLLDIHDHVKPIPGEHVIIKKYPGSFKNTLLLKMLKEYNINELVLCGMMSHMCLDTTTREAFDLDYKCIVIHDACATRTLYFRGKEIPADYVHNCTMAALEFGFAKVISTEEFIR